jgi:hypothetical protein
MHYIAMERILNTGVFQSTKLPITHAKRPHEDCNLHNTILSTSHHKRQQELPAISNQWGLLAIGIYPSQPKPQNGKKNTPTKTQAEGQTIFQSSMEMTVHNFY